jgi:hypothetical protein
MDWLVAAPWSEQEAFPTEAVATLLAWYSVIVAVLLLVLSVAAVMIVYRRQRLWCVQAERIAEVEFEEVGFPGCRRAAAVYSCSLFSPPTHVTCDRRCLAELDSARRSLTPTTLRGSAHETEAG